MAIELITAFEIGDRVTHDTFGKGKITEIIVSEFTLDDTDDGDIEPYARFCVEFKGTTRLLDAQWLRKAV